MVWLNCLSELLCVWVGGAGLDFEALKSLSQPPAACLQPPQSLLSDLFSTWAPCIPSPRPRGLWGFSKGEPSSPTPRLPRLVNSNWNAYSPHSINTVGDLIHPRPQMPKRPSKIFLFISASQPWLQPDQEQSEAKELCNVINKRHHLTISRGCGQERMQNRAGP